MTRVCLMLCCLALLPLAASPAAAAPSFGGYTGLILTPTADALDQDDYNAAVFTRDLEEGADQNLYAANLGLRAGLEAGFARFKPEGGPGETLLNAKYRFAPETDANPALAIGAIDLTDEIDSTVYFVMSKVLTETGRVKGREFISPRIHLGLAGGQIDGLFAGLSAALGESLTLMAEYDSEDINFGARLALGDEIRLHASTLDGLDDLGIGISFNKSM